MNFGIDIYYFSSFAMAIQQHVMKAIAKINDIDYEPSFRQNPYAAFRGIPKPPQELTLILFLLIFAIQLIFVSINIQ